METQRYVKSGNEGYVSQSSNHENTDGSPHPVNFAVPNQSRTLGALIRAEAPKTNTKATLTAIDTTSSQEPTRDLEKPLKSTSTIKTESQPAAQASKIPTEERTLNDRYLPKTASFGHRPPLT